MGVVLVDPTQAEPYLRLGQPVSQGALALVTRGDVDCSLATVALSPCCKHATLRAVSATNGTALQILDNPSPFSRRGGGVFTAPPLNPCLLLQPPFFRFSSDCQRSLNVHCKPTQACLACVWSPERTVLNCPRPGTQSYGFRAARSKRLCC